MRPAAVMVFGGPTSQSAFDISLPWLASGRDVAHAGHGQRQRVLRGAGWFAESARDAAALRVFYFGSKIGSRKARTRGTTTSGFINRSCRCPSIRRTVQPKSSSSGRFSASSGPTVSKWLRCARKGKGTAGTGSR